MTTIISNYTEARFSKDDSALLLIDHQSGIMQLNHDPTPVEFRSAAIALAKVGKIFNLPTIITSSYETGPNDPFLCWSDHTRVSIMVTSSHFSTVDAENLAGNKRRPVRSQEEDRLRNLFRTSHAL